MSASFSFRAVFMCTVFTHPFSTVHFTPFVNLRLKRNVNFKESKLNEELLLLIKIDWMLTSDKVNLSVRYF